MCLTSGNRTGIVQIWQRLNLAYNKDVTTPYKLESTMNNEQNYAGDYSVTVLEDGTIVMQEVDAIVINLEAEQAE